jgi:hypothetical protein
VQIAVMGAAKGDGKLVADFLSKSVSLCKLQMMRVTGLSAADQAGLLGDELQMIAITLSQRLWNCEPI